MAIHLILAVLEAYKPYSWHSTSRSARRISRSCHFALLYTTACGSAKIFVSSTGHESCGLLGRFVSLRPHLSSVLAHTIRTFCFSLAPRAYALQPPPPTLFFQPDLREVMNMTGKVGGARASASPVTPQNSEKRVKSNARVKNYS